MNLTLRLSFNSFANDAYLSIYNFTHFSIYRDLYLHFIEIHCL